ncbi:unnamed protein product [Adineta ricciae]|uniref:Uncharacterized protein n=1 Tax=Adineta ricciae TaxID=249248 RepID=A0A816GSS8_ADIRI|nr:unnamed protein product [Adineta ricciae]
MIIAHSENERSGEETDISVDRRYRNELQTSRSSKFQGTLDNSTAPHLGENGFFTEPDGKGKKSTKIRRNPFKKGAFAILFVVFVKHRVHQNRSHRSIQSPSLAIHKIRLQELLVALHRVYLEPDGPVFNKLFRGY